MMKIQRHGKTKTAQIHTVGYKEKVSDKSTLNTKYKDTFRTYEDNPTESNAVRKSILAGFDYQF